MIYKLIKRFIGICIASFVSVFAIMLVLICALTSAETVRRLDREADLISENGGKFPLFGNGGPGDHTPPMPDGFNRESPFTTRYFTVYTDKNGNITDTDTEHVSGVSREQAEAFAHGALKKGSERGWSDDYRYKLYDTEDGHGLVFVSSVSLGQSNRSFLLGASAVFAVCSVVVIILIILISGKAVKPAASSYEKQKQFLTDAGHELKTPLTLIKTNLDILSAEMGESEWLTDIKEETEIMSSMVNKLVALARMDEDGADIEHVPLDLSAAVEDTVSLFVTAASREAKQLHMNIAQGICISGDEGLIRRLISILMDNALKYCDAEGKITVALTGGRHPVLTVENSYENVDNVELGRLFDRFYRADAARTYGSGHGIGLSMARAIMEKQKGSIHAYRACDGIMGMRVRF